VKPEERPPLLDGLGFHGRIAGELARITRRGGFLSLMVFGSTVREEGEGVRRRLDLLGHLFQDRLRTQDCLGNLGTTLGILMPDTDMRQAVQVAERLLRVASAQSGGGGSAGLATVYGVLEGGADALLMAAQEAFHSAAAGQAVSSTLLDGRPRVLVVDDDPQFSQALADTITEAGWQADPSTDTADSLERVKGSYYNALFVDLMMPGLSGVDLLRLWLEQKPPRPAVLMSGFDADRGAVLSALSLGPVMFVKKPISQADIDQALRMFRFLLPETPHRRL
jgi:CheY-like chemotaxis protein